MNTQASSQQIRQLHLQIKLLSTLERWESILPFCKSTIITRIYNISMSLIILNNPILNNIELQITAILLQLFTSIVKMGSGFWGIPELSILGKGSVRIEVGVDEHKLGEMCQIVNNLAKGEKEMVKELLATVLEIDIGAHSSGKAQVYIYIYIYLYI